ncbi:reverse transcriptase [Tanacetum coccineum]
MFKDRSFHEHLRASNACEDALFWGTHNPSYVNLCNSQCQTKSTEARLYKAHLDPFWGHDNDVTCKEKSRGEEIPEPTKKITKLPHELDIMGQEGSNNNTRIISGTKCVANKDQSDVHVGTNQLKVWKRRPRPGVENSLDNGNTNEVHRGKRVYEDFIDAGNMDVDIVKKPKESLGNPWTVRHLRTLVNDSCSTIMFLMEAHMHDSEVTGLKFSFPQYNLLVVNPVGRAGGLLLFWKKDCDLSVASFTKNHIDFVVKEENGTVWREIGKTKVQPNEMVAFRHTCDICNLEDMDATGVKFTWSNGRQGCDNVKKGLDRFLANADWCRQYPSALFQNLARISSYHSPIACHLNPRVHAWMSGLSIGRQSDPCLIMEECVGPLESDIRINISQGDFFIPFDIKQSFSCLVNLLEVKKHVSASVKEIDNVQLGIVNQTELKLFPRVLHQFLYRCIH